MKNAFVKATAALALAMPAVSPAQDIVPPKTYTMTPGGVSLGDGSFTFTEVDLSIGNLQLTRYSLGGQKDPNDPFFGPRMSHNFDIYVAPNQRQVCHTSTWCEHFYKPIVHMGLSASGTYYETFPPNPIIVPANDDAFSGVLARNVSSGAYVYTDRDGTVYTFSTTVIAAGASSNTRRVADIVFPDGRRQDFLYNGSGQLKAVTDSAGYAIVFDYNAAGLVSVACGYNRAETYVTVASTCTGAALKVSYGYTGSPARLTSVTDVHSGVTTYGRSNDRITCVTPPGYSSCKISNTYQTYGNHWQVIQQTLEDGGTWNFSYGGDFLKTRNPEETIDIEPGTTSQVTDPYSKISTYTFVMSSPFSATDANGNVTNYRFRGGTDIWAVPDTSLNHGSSLVEVSYPEENQYLAEYAGPRRSVSKETLRAKPGPEPRPADIVKLYGYVADCTTAPNTPQNCAKPIWIRDPKGNQTDFTYASWGGALSEMQPAPVSGAARPLKLLTWVQKSASIKNSGGTLSAGPALWLPATETLCQTIAGSSVATCDPAAPITVTSYEYGTDGTANNLLLRGKVVTADGVSLRTCYGYDGRGNKIFETSPRGAPTTACQ